MLDDYSAEQLMAARQAASVEVVGLTAQAGELCIPMEILLVICLVLLLFCICK